MITQVYVAMGANLVSPVTQLDRAVIALKTLASDAQLQVSPYYRSAPMDHSDQPDYINGVASFTTSLKPLELLDALQAIEQQQGRVRNEHWGARTLDLDLLLYGNDIIDHPRLTVPHYGMKQRSFVLIPLNDLVADLVLPCGTSLSRLISKKMQMQLRRLDRAS